MGYCVNFKYVDKLTNEIIDKKRQACFSLFYGRFTLETFDNIEVYVLKTYTDIYKSENKLDYNKDDVYFYIDNLNKIYNCIKVEETELEYIFTISNTNVTATKMMLNCIRYLHESPYRDIPSIFIEMCKNKKLNFINNYSKLILSHYQTGLNVNRGHDFMKADFMNVCSKLCSNKEVKDFFEKYKNINDKYLYQILPEIKKNISNYNIIREKIFLKQYNEAYKNYKLMYKVKKNKIKKQKVIKKLELNEI